MPYCRMYYHIVWTTKHRQPLLVGNVREAVYRAIITKAHDLGGLVYALNGMPDHVHLVAAIPPRIAVATFIGQIKGLSSYVASHMEPADDRPYTPFAWQREYGIGTVSERGLASVVRYVVRQQIHHAAASRRLTSLEWTADDGRP